MKHLDITEFLCDECGEAFAMQKLLRKHVVTMHGSEELRYREKYNHSCRRSEDPESGFFILKS
jgi:hypothetical protein